MDSEHIILIHKQLEGSISSSELHTLEQWLKSDDEHHVLFHQYTTIWQNSQDQLPAFQPNVSNAWNKVVPKLKISNEPSDTSSIAAPLKISYKKWSALAAAAVVLLGLAWWMGKDTFSTPTPPAIVFERVQSSSTMLTHQHVDGSVIDLNENSTLSFDKENPRHVVIEGEGYFKVARDTAHPFTVQAGEVTVTVLGTEFNVQAYPDSNLIEVSVAEGQVTAQVRQGKFNMIANKKVIYNKEKNTFLLTSDYFQNDMAWKTKRLKFKNMLLSTCLTAAAKYYNAEFSLSLLNVGSCPFTGEFDQTDLEGFVKSVSTAFNFKVQKNGDRSYHFIGEHCY